MSLIFASIAPPAQGQEPPPPRPTEAVTERVIVTGSNIPTAQEQSSLPVTTSIRNRFWYIALSKKF